MPIFVQVSFGFSDLTHVVCLLTVNEIEFLSLPQMRIIHQPVVFWGLVCSRWSHKRQHRDRALLLQASTAKPLLILMALWGARACYCVGRLHVQTTSLCCSHTARHDGQTPLLGPGGRGRFAWFTRVEALNSHP